MSNIKGARLSDEDRQLNFSVLVFHINTQLNMACQNNTRDKFNDHDSSVFSSVPSLNITKYTDKC